MRTHLERLPSWTIPTLALAFGGTAVAGAYVVINHKTAQAEAAHIEAVRTDVVRQYIDNSGCLAYGPYDNRDGRRENIEVTGIGTPGPTVVNLWKNPEHTDAIHLHYVGKPDGGTELAPADRFSYQALKDLGCRVPEVM